MPELANFDTELRFIEKAATVSLENVMTDVHELDKGMELTRKEFEMRKDFKDHDKQNTVLKDFLSNAEEKLRRLRSEAKAAQDAFNECVEYFGDSPRQTDANAFFGLFVRFIKAYKVIIQILKLIQGSWMWFDFILPLYGITCELWILVTRDSIEICVLIWYLDINFSL